MSYKAIITAIQSVEAIPKADRIQIGLCLGERVVVSKEVNVGDVGVYFQPDLRLSEEYCHENNLFRHSNLNKDNTKSGFFEDNRRVRVQPFLGMKSEGLFMPLSSLNYTQNYPDVFDGVLGTQFDEVGSHKICEKYISEKAQKALANAAKGGQKKKAVETPFFAKHTDTDQFRHYAHTIKPGTLITLHAKVHGTSARYAHTKVFKELPTWKKLVNKVVNIFPEYEWDYVVGTRNVIIYEDNKTKEGFHGSEQFRFDILDELKPYLAKGMAVYGEIAGYVNGKPIMPKHSMESLKNKEFTKKYGKEITYSYNCHEAEYRFHVYRITYTLENGESLDFSDAQIKQWCLAHSFNTPYEVEETFVFDGDHEDLTVRVEHATDRPEFLTEDYIDPSHISEGIIIRCDYGKTAPVFYKNKSFAFKVLEGIASENEVDLESIS